METNDLSKHLFEQMTTINEGQRIAIKLGREQFAREVCGCKTLGEVAALCDRELKKREAE